MSNESSHDYHTFTLPEEKTQRAVHRGIPQIISKGEVKQNLIDTEF